MGPVAYSCPKCRVVLKSATAIPTGKTVKCPKCTTVFTPSSPTQVTARPALQPIRKSAQGIQPIGKSSQGVKRPSRSIQNAAMGVPRRGRGVLVASLFAACLLLFTCVGSSVAVYALKFNENLQAKLGLAGTTEDFAVVGNTLSFDDLKSTIPLSTAKKTDPTPAPVPPSIDALAYVPADSSLLMGTRLSSLLKQPMIAQALEPVFKGEKAAKFLAEVKVNTGIDAQDLCEEIVIAGKPESKKRPMADKGMLLGPFGGIQDFLPSGKGVGDSDPITVVFKSKIPFDRKKLAKALAIDGTAVKVGNSEYYKPPEGLNGPTALIMPNDRIIILTSLPDEKLDPLLSAKSNQPAVAPDLVSMVRKIDQNHIWLAMAIDDGMRRELQQNLPQLAAQAPPEVQAAVPALSQARGLAIWGGLEGNQIKLNVGVNCANGNHAEQLKVSLDHVWNEYVKKMAGQPPFSEQIATLPPYLQTTVKEILQGTQISRNDTMAQVTIKVSTQPLEALFKDAQSNPSTITELITVGGPPAGLDVNLAKEHAELLKLTSEHRVKNNLPPHRHNRKLDKAAQGYVDKLAKQGMFDAAVNVQAIADSAIADGYKLKVMDGNGAFGEGVTGKAAFTVWTDSKMAEKVILDKQYEEVGIGIAKSAKGELFYVQVYATPQK
jgi:uncharacterized protein YkwD